MTGELAATEDLITPAVGRAVEGGGAGVPGSFTVGVVGFTDLCAGKYMSSTMDSSLMGRERDPVSFAAGVLSCELNSLSAVSRCRCASAVPGEPD